jgi:hypothetical protein
MGWNDRLIDDPYGPTDEERQSFFDWQEYQHYCAMLDAEIEQQSAPPAPERMGISSQMIDPDSFGGLSKDIFSARPLTPKESAHARDQDEDQAKDKGQDQHQDQGQRG